MNTSTSSLLRHALAGVLLLGIAARDASADAITDWNAALESTLAVPSERGPAVPDRTYAILHAAMFDAVNGIVRKYEPLHVTDAPPPGAHPEAAAIQAAFTALSALRPGNQSVWDTQLATSLATLPGHPGWAQSIQRGRDWGAAVATAILAWRTGDVGTPDPLQAETGVGYWKHSSLITTALAGYPSLATRPFLIEDPDAFDPGAPYGESDRAKALQTASYAADVNESLARGGATSAVRTADEEFEALFLHAADIASLNRLLRSLVRERARLVENARVFALLNAGMFDARLVFFSAKYRHQLWRPYQAINQALNDGNDATTPPADPWSSLRPTPSHPEYPSAHVMLFTLATHLMSRLYGDCHEVEFHAPGYADPLVYPDLAAISDASIEARVNIGFHFRESCEVSQILGREIADHLLENFLEPRHRPRRHCFGGLRGRR